MKTNGLVAPDPVRLLLKLETRCVFIKAAVVQMFYN